MRSPLTTVPGVFFGSTKVIMPNSGGSQTKRVAATASRIRSEANSWPSCRNKLLTHAPAHACFTYWATDQDVTHSEGEVVLIIKSQRPGVQNCGFPSFWRFKSRSAIFLHPTRNRVALGKSESD